MESTVEKLSDTRVKVAVRVPFGEMKSSLDKAYRTIAGEIRVPGFRPGKAPARIIDQRVGRAAVLNEAVQNLIPQAYSEAVTANELPVVGNPDIELTTLDDGELVAFTAEVDVRPDIEVPAELEVTLDDTGELTDDDLNNRLDSLRERFATLKNADRPVADGDYVSIDIVSKVDGVEIAAGSATGLSYEVGSDQLMPGLDAALVGLSANDSTTFPSPLETGEHAGKTAEITVTVRSVKEKELPELNDEFAQIASEFDSLDELRDDLRSTFQYVKKIEHMSTVRQQTIEALLAAVEFPLPQGMVDAELEFRQRRIFDELESNNITIEKYLSLQGQSREEFDAELRQTTEGVVRTQLVLEAVADEEKIEVKDRELTEYVVRQAVQQYGQDDEKVKAYAAQLMRSGALVSIAAQIRRDKALDLIVKRAQITDPSGNKIDVAALQKAIENERPNRLQGQAQPAEIAAAADESAEPASSDE